MSKFFNELKRRNVIKSTIAYLVVAWIVIQVATAVLPTFGAGDWVLQAIIIILAIGLPIWIIISWVYDITPQGIEKTPEESEKQANKQLINKRLNAFLITSLSIAVVVMGLKISGVFSPNYGGDYSIAVLSFDNLSNDPEQEYFSDGVSTDIIGMLSKVTELTVMGRSSAFTFKESNLGAAEIGKELGVSLILDGSVQKSGNTLRIYVELINVADGSLLFSEEFNEEHKDIFVIQDKISRDILKATKIKLFGEEKEAVYKKYTDNLAAHDLYQEGFFYSYKGTLDNFKKAIDYYEQAIEIDSNYAIAYAGLSFCYANITDFNWSSLLGMTTKEALELAKDNAKKSLELDDQIAESHLAIGRIQLHQDWNIREAMKSFERAIEIKPSSAETLVQLGFCLTHYGRHEEAVQQANKAISLDKFSIVNLWYTSSSLIFADDIESVMENANKMIEIDPNNPVGYEWAGKAYSSLGDHDKAIEKLKLSAKLGAERNAQKGIQTGPGTFRLGILGGAYGRKGDTLKAKEIIEQIKAYPGYDLGANYSLVGVYLSIGDIDNVAYYMERSLENNEGQLFWITAGLRLSKSKLLEDPRIKPLIEKMNIVY
jgi:serine/threonine-protein kinase